MSSKLEPVIWLRVLVTLAYMKGQTDVRCTYVRTVDDVMAIKPNFLASMGYQYFLSYGARRTWSSAMNSLWRLENNVLKCLHSSAKQKH